MSNKLKGAIIVLNATEKVSDKFSKREFVIQTDGQYPQQIQLQLSQDKCSLLDSFTLGQVVEVDYNLRGRKWTNPQGEDKYFNTIEAWKISGEAIVTAKKKEEVHQAEVVQQEYDDELPF